MSLLPSLPPAILVLADGTVFRGNAVGATGIASGEVVFNTAMAGYQETLTDPSYCRQIVAMTYPHIGNVGCNDEDFESCANFAAGLVIRDLPLRGENWRLRETLPEYLKKHGVTAIANIDTRRLTRHLREKGAQAGCLMAGEVDEGRALVEARAFPGLTGMDLLKEVSAGAPYEWDEGAWTLEGFLPAAGVKYHVVAYDYGVRRSVLRMLAARGCRVTVVPARTPAADVLKYDPDGIFLSNGPGDAAPCDYAVAAVRELLASGIPVCGICFGHQVLALASGAKTVKLKSGQHGANHPVRDLETGQVSITCQNHGFAVDAGSLPAHLRATHVSLFDGSLQGIARIDVPAFSFQGYPEVSPERYNMAHPFDRFISMMQARKAGRK